MALQQRDQAVAPDGAAGFQAADRLADAERGEHALQAGVDGRNQQLRRFDRGLKPVQCRQPFRADRQRRAGSVIGQAIPPGNSITSILARNNVRLSVMARIAASSGAMKMARLCWTNAARARSASTKGCAPRANPTRVSGAFAVRMRAMSGMIGDPRLDLARNVHIIEPKHRLHQRAGILVGHGLRAQRPGHDIDVFFFDQPFEQHEFGLGPSGVVAIEETADHIIRLTRAAMPRAEFQTAKAVVTSMRCPRPIHPRSQYGRKVQAAQEPVGIAQHGGWRGGPVKAGAMRPERLNPLFAATDGLKGVGPGLARPLERLGLSRVKDLAYHLPDRFVTRRVVADLDEAAAGEQIVVALTPVNYRSSASPRAPFRVMAADAAGNVCALTWFGRGSGAAKKKLPLGETRWIAGRLDQFGDSKQIVHPDHILSEGGAALGQTAEPVYPLADGLTQGRLAALVAQALAAAPDLPEWIEPHLLAREGWPTWAAALAEAHRGPAEKARDRLAYDELLANALALMLVREAGRARKGTPLHGRWGFAGAAEPALCTDGGADARDCGDRGRYAAGRADAAPAARRCRQRQDGGGAARDADRGGGGNAGGPAGPDRNFGAPALCLSVGDVGGDGGGDCAADRPRQGAGRAKARCWA